MPFPPIRTCILAGWTALTVAAPPAQAVATRNMQVLAHVNEYPTPVQGLRYAYSSCWTYVHGDGREYALLGTSGGTAIYNVTNPANVYRTGFIPGPPSIWREMKSYRNWVYVVTEGSQGLHGVHIIRMANPENPVLGEVYTGGFFRSHTVRVDTTRALLICSGTWDPFGRQTGVRILSLANPEQLTEVSWWPGGTLPFNDSLYVHDAFVRGNRLYLSSIGAGRLHVVDFTNPAQLTNLATFSYPGARTHSSASDATDRYHYVCDEENGEPMKVFDLANLASPELVYTFTPSPKAIVHNAHVRGNELYLSAYTEGVRVCDISNPRRPAEFAWADVYGGPSGGYSGVWEVAPQLPSGNIVASDMQGGLWVFRPQRNYGLLDVEVVDGGSGFPIEGLTVRLDSPGDSLVTPADGVVRFAPSPGSHTVEVRAFGYVTATRTVSVTLGATGSLRIPMFRRTTTSVSGLVWRDDTDTPIAEAAVDVADTPLHAQSNALGAYTFGLVPSDVYTMRASAPGFVSKQASVPVGPNPVTVDWSLAPAAAWDPLEVAGSWAVGAPGDDATSGLWTRVVPQGTGPRPAAQSYGCGCGSCGPDCCCSVANARAGSGCASVGNGANARAGSGCALSRRAPLAASVRKPWATPLHEEALIPRFDNAAPYLDRTPNGTFCFVTGQGTDTTNVDQADVDGGQTTLTSPPFALSDMAEPVLAWWQWFYSFESGDTEQPDPSDGLVVQLSGNGVTWVTVDTTRGIENRWHEHRVRVNDYIVPTSQVRVRFIALDRGVGSTVEAAIDDLSAWDEPAVVLQAPAATRSLNVRALSANPARGSVRLGVTLPTSGSVTLSVHDAFGRRVHHATRAAGAGPLVLEWDGRDAGGRPAPAGLYFAQVQSASLTATRRVVLAR